MNLFKYQHYDIENNYISINLPAEYELKKIERKTIFYLDIWNNSEFVYQFLKLNDINVSIERDLSFFNPKNYQRNIYFDLIDKDEVLEIEKNYTLFKNSKNIIHYPKIHSNSYIKKKFKSFSESQICDAIKKEIENENNLYDLANPKIERDYWLRYCNQFNKKEFLEINSNFKINYHETYLILDLEHKNKTIKKILKYDIQVGN